MSKESFLNAVKELQAVARDYVVVAGQAIERSKLPSSMAQPEAAPIRRDSSEHEVGQDEAL